MNSRVRHRLTLCCRRHLLLVAVTPPSRAKIPRQEARLKMEKNLEKEKSVLMSTASNQDNQDGTLEITVSGEKYNCVRFSKAKK
ncbi:hypothetical protein GUJ93_ZPchr0013g35186 [Zizania palustris]|uniref:Uncharacterized protein n=1 Tax=Zizania palustris TaxID=103762 RepID=A0A8J5WQM4_ZIZPA|nr:hypothetical protein GUJ93_ZPchr0013g35186 [Zizania palustris]